VTDTIVDRYHFDYAGLNMIDVAHRGSVTVEFQYNPRTTEQEATIEALEWVVANLKHKANELKGSAH